MVVRHSMEHTLQHACFTCRKVFKKTVPGKSRELPRDCYGLGMTETLSFRCPECGGSLYAMGKTFRAPRSSQVEQWKVIELLFHAGFRFISGRDIHAELPTRLRDVGQFIRENLDCPLRLPKANRVGGGISPTKPLARH
jgi:hypothetical protein